jgi:hypothetical protein
MAADRRRKQRSQILRKRIAIMAIAAAATVVFGAVAFFFRPGSAGIVCPHGSKEALENLAIPREKLRAFLHDPDRYPRICACTPTYSGELRTKETFESLLPDPVIPRTQRR